MNQRQRTCTKRVTAVTVLLVLLAGLLAACGSDDSTTDLGPAANPPDFEPALAQAPPKLAALYEPGGVLLPGGLDAFSEQLAAVEGYPVVVNNWASWCGPCRTEWPWFQDAAAEHLDEVAFIGVDGEDSDEAAATFLRDYPVPYPSFADYEKELGNEVGVALVGGFPNTLFFDSDGELVYTHQGVYPDQESFQADLAKYALDAS